MEYNIIMHHGCYNVLYIYYCPFYRCRVVVTINKHQWKVVVETSVVQCNCIPSSFLYNYLPLVFINCYGDPALVEGTIVRDVVTPMMHYDVMLHLVFVYIGLNCALFPIVLVFKAEQSHPQIVY